MRQLNGVYTQKYNGRHDRVGHLFQGRYKALVVEKDAYLLELSRYIALNPVRAGMVSSPEDWPWSSYGVTSGMKPQESFLHTDFLLGVFSPSKVQARRLYTNFVTEGLDRESPLKEARGGLILGHAAFVDEVRKLIEESETGEAVRAEKYAARPPLSEIFAGVDRDDGIHEAVYRWGYKLKDVGNYLGLHYSRISKIAGKTAKSKT